MADAKTPAAKTPEPATDEQRNLIRLGVKRKAIESIDLEKWKTMTKKDAAKIIKDNKLAELANQPEAPRQLPGGDGPATKFQLNAISRAVNNGEFERLDKEKFANLTKQEAYEILAGVAARRPPEPATQSQKDKLIDLVHAGYLSPVKRETFLELEKSEASRLISIGCDREERGEKVPGFDPAKAPEKREPIDRNGPATDAQKERLTQLVNDGYLNGVSFVKWREMTAGEAGKLIFVGKMREEKGEKAPERPARAQDAPGAER